MQLTDGGGVFIDSTESMADTKGLMRSTDTTAQAGSMPSWQALAEPASRRWRCIGCEANTFLAMARRDPGLCANCGEPKLRALRAEDRFPPGAGPPAG